MKRANEHLIEAFLRADLSLGQLAHKMNLSIEETMRYLSERNIPVTDYDIEEDIRGIEVFMNDREEGR
jgi:predicted HTH domain antitoxin